MKKWEMTVEVSVEVDVKRIKRNKSAQQLVWLLWIVFKYTVKNFVSWLLPVAFNYCLFLRWIVSRQILLKQYRITQVEYVRLTPTCDATQTHNDKIYLPTESFILDCLLLTRKKYFLLNKIFNSQDLFAEYSVFWLKILGKVI